MNAAEYLAWARPLLGSGYAERIFLNLPGELSTAGGAGHFLESSAASDAGLSRLKLALILEDSPAALALDAVRRDAPGKVQAATSLLSTIKGEYDRRPAAAVLDCLKRWALRGSLMLSVDFERERGAFGKLSFYGYLPGPERLGELLAAFGRGGLEPALRPLAGATLAFFGVDLAPGAPAALKLYNKTAYPDRALEGPAAAAAQSLLEAGPLRDVTRLTRVGSDAGPKAYLGFARGVPLETLSRLPCMGGSGGWLGEAARAAPGQRARFVGFDHGAVEVYFDRSGFGPEEERRP